MRTRRWIWLSFGFLGDSSFSCGSCFSRALLLIQAPKSWEDFPSAKLFQCLRAPSAHPSGFVWKWFLGKHIFHFSFPEESPQFTSRI